MDVLGGAGELYERDVERAAILAALDRAAEGRGTLLAIEGPTGAGVTAVVALAIAEGRARGLAIGEARATIGARDARLGVARQLLAGREPVDDAEPAAYAEAVLAAAREAGTAPGLLLAVEDAHHADAASLRALAALAPWVADLPIVLVLGADPTAAPPELLRLLAEPAALALTPAPLSEAAVETWARARLGAVLSEGVAAELAWLTAGRPRLVAAALDAFAERGLSGAGAAAAIAADVPGPVARRARAVVAELPPEAVALARTLAVLGDPVWLTQAAPAAGLERDAAGRAADALAAAGLIDGGEPMAFREPLIACAIDQQTPPFERVDRHRRAADALRGDRSAVERRARHLARLWPAGEAETVRVLRAAAAAAAERGDRGAAVEHLRRALVEPPPEPERAAVLAELALAEAAAGAHEALERLTHALQAATDPSSRGELRTALARLHLARADYATAAAEAQAGLAEIGNDPRGEGLMVVELVAQTVDPTLAPDAAARTMPILALVAAGGPLPTDPGLCAWLAAALSAVGGPAEVTRALLDRALRDTPLVDEHHAAIHSFARAALMNLDDLDEVERVATAAMDRAAARGWELAVALAQHGRAEARFGAGRVADAIADAEAALTIREQGWTVHAPYAAALLVHAQLERGEVAAAHAALATAEEYATAGPLEQMRVRMAALAAAVADGRPGPALDALVQASEQLAAFGVTLSPAALPWASHAALGAAAAGRLDEARAMAGDELERARAFGLPGPLGAALRAAAAAETGEARIALLREAVATSARSPRRLEEAYALADLGDALAEAGDRVGAREPLAAALDLADRCGATVLADRARSGLRRAGARPRRAARTGAAALTPAERRVAERAAEGDTNAEIAAELFLSVKTVEGTLRRAFRKLGIAARGELAEALAASR